MPFIRQTRDKNGFESTSVLHLYHPGGGGGQRPRVLYLFRSPANMKVGRQPLDAEVMEALEHTHPDLSFDWGSITRETPPPPRPSSPNDRHMRRPPPRPNDRSKRPPQPPPAVALPPVVVVDDPSVLGRTLGSAESGRLRQRYSELIQRIARRGRTPEERDRLSERTRRLNPDDWTDESSIRANAPGVDRAWDAIAAELPSRRRGRRGGRRRLETEAGRPQSAIMTTGEGQHEVSEVAHVAGRAEPDGSGGDGSSFGADSDSTTDSADTDLPVGD